MWGVPINHEYFENTNRAQWLWYFYNSLKDNEDEFINSRNMIEYHAGFLAPELVQKIRNSREENKDNVIGTKDEKAFGDSIKQIFGRDPGIAPKQSGGNIKGEVHHIDNVLDRIAEYEKTQQELEHTPAYNYKHWSDFDLE